MDLTKAIILGLVQGLTEFLPVSSSGHLALFQYFFNLSSISIMFDVFLHLGTLFAVFIFFFKDILKIIKTPRTWPIYIVASIPAGVFGIVLEKIGVEKIFSSLLLVGAGFLVTSILLWISNWRHKTRLDSRLDSAKQAARLVSPLPFDKLRASSFSQLPWGKAFLIGLFQGMAILPGISRSGSTITGGLLVGLSREEAFRFSFILSIPAILGAVLLGILGGLGGSEGLGIELIIGMMVAMVVGYFALLLLKKLVLEGNLRWFALYTLVVAGVCFYFGFFERGNTWATQGVAPTEYKSKFESLLKGVEIPKLTIDSVFSSDHSWVNNLPNDRTVTLIATGDVGLVRSVNTRMIANGIDYPFLKTAEFLRSGDITLINLEGPLTKNCIPTDVGMVFCGRAENAEALVNAGIDVVNFANNHTYDQGVVGAEETIQILKDHTFVTAGFTPDAKKTEEGGSVGIKPASQSLGGPTVTAKGMTFAFLGWNVLDGVDEDRLIREINTNKEDGRGLTPPLQGTQFLVCSFHWGDEYTLYPNLTQKRLAHLAIDSGCDLIIGNHPHWVQATEIYLGKFITYSHGNFIFDQMWSRETREGVVGKYTLFDGNLVDVEFFPVLIEDYAQPRFLEGEEADVVLGRMKKASFFK